MVLPLIGLLAAGLGSAGLMSIARPYLENREEDVLQRGRARRYQQATGTPTANFDPALGYDPTVGPEGFHDEPSGLLSQAVTPYDYNASLMRAGLLAPDMLQDPYGLEQLSNEGAMARAELAEQGAWGRAQLGEQGAMDRLVYGTEHQPLAPQQPLFSYSDPAKFSADVDSYTRQGAAIGAADAAIDFLDTYGGLGEWANVDQRSRISAQLRTSALPEVAQTVMQAGAMSDDERPYFEAIAGGNFDKLLGDAKGRASLEALIDRMSEMQQNRFAAFVNSNLVPPGMAGEAILQRLGQFGVAPPTQRKQRETTRTPEEVGNMPRYGGG